MVHVEVNEQPTIHTRERQERDPWGIPPSYMRFQEKEPWQIHLSTPGRKFHEVLVNQQPVGMLGLEEVPAKKLSTPNGKAWFLIGLWLHPDSQPYAWIEAQAVSKLGDIVSRNPAHGLYALVNVGDSHFAQMFRTVQFKQKLELPSCLNLLNTPMFYVGFDGLV
jgi:hypothetical protein